MRTFLRLEHLLARLHYHAADTSDWGRRAAMSALLDILNVMSRSDLRSEISQEIGARYASLETLADRDDIDGAVLAQVLAELDALNGTLACVPPQWAAVQVRDNALLDSLNHRVAIPGGCCGFDLPAYQHWLAQPAARIDADINRWRRRIQPFEAAIALLLRLLRDSADAQPAVAENGVLVYYTEAGAQMIRVLLEAPDVYPEISAGRHRATIRFLHTYDDQHHVRQVQAPIAFRLACCRF